VHKRILKFMKRAEAEALNPSLKLQQLSE